MLHLEVGKSGERGEREEGRRRQEEQKKTRDCEPQQLGIFLRGIGLSTQQRSPGVRW